MKTTVAFFLGDIKPEHKNLQTYRFNNGYAVEEKGVSFENNFEDLQKLRFEKTEDLVRIDIHEPGCQPITLLR